MGQRGEERVQRGRDLLRCHMPDCVGTHTHDKYEQKHKVTVAVTNRIMNVHFHEGQDEAFPYASRVEAQALCLLNTGKHNRAHASRPHSRTWLQVAARSASVVRPELSA